MKPCLDSPTLFLDLMFFHRLVPAVFIFFYPFLHCTLLAISEVCLLASQIVLNDPVEKYMIPFQEAQPLHADLILEEVVMRFFKDPVVPIVDDWGSCVGIVHRQDCTKVRYLL